jgi:hypothetical protein
LPSTRSKSHPMTTSSRTEARQSFYSLLAAIPAAALVAWATFGLTHFVV